MTAAAVVFALVGAVVGSAGFVLVLRHSLQQSLVASARQQAAAVVAQLQDGSAPQRAVVGTTDDVTTQILDAGGRVVASDRARPFAALRKTQGVSHDVRVAGLHDSYVAVADRADAGLLVVVGKSTEDVEGATRTAVALLLGVVPLGVLLMGAVVWISVGRALSPVERMRRQAALITSTDLHRRLTAPEGADEISLLARTLNQMLDRIDSSQRLQRQFVSDASHELRSPLASMRQLTEVASRLPDSMTIEELAGEIRAEEQRMEELVTALLTLARLDDAPGGAAAVVDLEDVVLDELARARDVVGAHPRVRVSVRDLAAARVPGHPVLMAQLVRNLVSNALRHADTTVEVRLSTYDGTAELAVDDDGQGIADEDRERVFGRFVRLDEARGRDSGGSGLGLAIVRKVATESGGGASVERSPLGGARLVVTLPVA